MSNHQHRHRNSKDCEKLLGQLSDYIDGELEAALCAEIEQHLSSCTDCQVLVDTTQKTIALYRRRHQKVEAELSPDISQRLWQALTEANITAQND